MNATSIAEALAVAPRLDLKRRFAAFAARHCKRKPALQMGWPDPSCRKVPPDAPGRFVGEEIASVPSEE